VWLWPTQIDVRSTVLRYIHKLGPPTETLATRDPHKIYQNGKPVGDITGPIIEKDNIITFIELSSTSKLNKDIPFEYGRKFFQIIRIGSITGLKIEVGNERMQQKKSVMANVVCQEVK